VRGIVYTGEGNAEVTDDLEVRGPGPTEVVVRMVAAGVCHSDLSVLDGTIPFPTPVVMGHEGAGVVEAVGDAVVTCKPGDHVVVSTLANCGVCKWCNTGHPTWCRKSFGNMTQPFTYKGEPAWNFAAASSFGERTVVSQIQAVPISEDIPFTSACLIGCGVLAGVGAVLNRARVRPGDTAAVFGSGGVGLNVIQALRLSQATKIVAVDTMESKRELALEFGATDFVNAADTDAVEAVKELTGGGVMWSFECVGHPAVLRDSIDVLDWGGMAVAVGVPKPTDEVSVVITHVTHVDRGVMGTRYGSSRPQFDIPAYVDLYLNGELKLDELVTKTYPLDDFHTVVEDMHAGTLARGVLEF
jgi:S-(hydroxymethyl)glutathione dehydrogenase/alcohol dehydrogenase